MVLTIIEFPNELLDQRSEPIRKMNNDLRELGKSMLETMMSLNGLGLSAVQVGRLVRVICMKKSDGKNLLMYNPIIAQKSNTRRNNMEQCLSFKNEETYLVPSHISVKVKYLDINNKNKFVELENLDAVIFQHEMNHLNGITMDKVGKKIEVEQE